MAFDFEYYRLVSGSQFPGVRHWASTVVNRASQLGISDSLLKDTVYSSPIDITRATKLTQVGVITGNDAGLNVKVAIYDATSQDDLTPKNLVLNCGTVNAGTSDGFGVVQTTLSPSTGLSAGFYWISIIIDVNHVIGTNNVSGSASFAWPALGWDLSTMQPYFGWSAPLSYAGGFTSSYPASPTKRFFGPTTFVTPAC